MLRVAGTLAMVMLAVGAAPAGAATIGGTAWKDDGDGVRGSAEERAAGVKLAVQRRTAQGAFRTVAKRTTGRRGRWSVRIRAAGAYRVIVTRPPWSTGFAAGADSDVTRLGRSAVRRLTPGGRSRRVDVGLLVSAGSPAPQPSPGPTPQPSPGPTPVPPVTIGDLVWNDLDDDGLQDAGEPGVAGVIVELWDAARTAKLADATTDASGAWTITLPSAASYLVRLVLPLNAIYTAGNVGDDTRDSDVHALGNMAGFTDPVSAGTTSLDAGIVFRALVNLGDRVWRDNNHNGIQEAGEAATAGVRVETWNASRTQVLAAATTDANGAYALIVPRDGSYRLHFSGPLSYTRPNAGADDALDSDVLAWGDDFGWTPVMSPNVNDSSIDAGGVTQPIAVGDLVWDDTNGNGQREAGEPGVAGVTVQLWNAGRTELIDGATTNASGNYLLEAPHAGDYRIRVVLPPARAFTLMNAAADTTDSDVNPSGANAGYTDVYAFPFNLVVIATIDAGLVPN